MKRYFAVAICMFFGICGCREISVITTVKTDGSMERVVITGDSSGVAEAAYPIPTDTSWTITYHETKDDSDRIEKKYKAVKTFRNVDELNEYLACKDDTIPRIDIKAGLKKKFRWFYTFFEYTETYKSYNQFHSVPPEAFFTDEEIKLIKAGVDSGKIDDKMEEWQELSIFEEFNQRFIAAAQNLGDPELTPEVIRSKRDQLLGIIQESEPESADHFINQLEEVLGTLAVRKLEGEIKSIYKDVEYKLEYMSNFFTTDFTSSVIMPGLLIDTTAPTVEGNKATWNFESGRFYIFDFQMFALSRVVNKWTFIVTVVICVGAILLLILSIVRKKNG